MRLDILPQFRRGPLAVGSAIAAGVLLAGCSGGPDPDTEATPDEESSPTASPEPSPSASEPAADGEYALPASCEEAKAAEAVADQVGESAELEEETSGITGVPDGQGITCVWGMGGAESDDLLILSLTYVEGVNPLENAEEEFQGPSEVTLGEPYSTAESEKADAELQHLDMGRQGGGVVAHLPGDFYIDVQTVPEPIDKGDMEKIVLTAAENLAGE
ncbi:hypothetical protein CLV63_13559 [Murinocardiopsis flavida]|uniref:DUF3558 domain-containing protein n=1 Tax=Murinocardiopsis flavida TaxID=645275 RepID=A0A2P8CMX4_9ACTN|nr:hypothetical protein [Murinocardiopsis flavida]PSK86290.1 hypothetical protein CLV63_13559 [Murinocardiopsis flavida]